MEKKEINEEIRFPEGITTKDISLIRAQCELQGADSKEQILGFAEAYLEAKNLAMDKEKLNSLAPEELEDLILRWAAIIERRNEKGLRTTEVTFKDGSMALKAENVPRAMINFSKSYLNMKPTEVYKEFQRIHPLEDGNGRLGDLLWKISKAKVTGNWPEELPPDIFKKS